MEAVTAKESTETSDLEHRNLTSCRAAKYLRQRQVSWQNTASLVVDLASSHGLQPGLPLAINTIKPSRDISHFGKPEMTVSGLAASCPSL